MRQTTHKTQPEILKSILPTDFKKAMTSQELFDELDSADRGRFRNPAYLGKAIDSMRRRGFDIKNGNSEIINGKLRLTWYISAEDKSNANDNSESKTVDEANRLNLSASSEAASTQTYINQGEIEVEKGQSLAEDIHEEISQTPDSPIPAIDAAIETFARDGYLFLTPDNPIDAQFIAIIQSFKSAQAIKPAPTIERKGLKIDTLDRLCNLMSDDIASVLNDVIADIDQLQPS